MQPQQSSTDPIERPPDTLTGDTSRSYWLRIIKQFG